MEFNVPRVVIAGERSGVGKSTITIGLIAALMRRGLKVQPFKTGPDFLDPMHHNAVAERVSRNLDTWMFPGYVNESFQRASEGADIAVIEGVMGFYDGYDGFSEEGSTAHLSKVLKAPVILVLNATSSARSLGAIAKGFVEYDKQVRIAGVIFNNVSGEKHLKMAESSLSGLESLGGIPRFEEISLKSRYLGLVPAQENYEKSRYERIRERIEENLNVDRIIEIAKSSEGLEAVTPGDGLGSLGTYKGSSSSGKASPKCKIGVAYDSAFNFYYYDNFEILRSLGAEITFFSPISESMPDVDGLYFGGGYPEVFASELSSNSVALQSVKALSMDDLPIYAECGGLMYLCRSIKGKDGKDWRMAGIFDAEIEMTAKLQALGYVQVTVTKENVLAESGAKIRGHVFHYSKVSDPTKEQFAYELDKEKGIAGKNDGFIVKNTLASYTHLHFGSNLKFASKFVDECSKRSKK